MSSFNVSLIKMSTKAEMALLAIESSPTKVHRTRSKSRPRSLDDEGELGAKSNKQAKLDSEQTSAKSNEVSTQGANLTNDDELADLDSRLDSRAEEADKVTGEKDSIPEGGEKQEEKKEEEEKEKEKEEEKKKEKTAEVKKADKKSKESADCVEVGNKVEETEKKKEEEKEKEKKKKKKKRRKEIQVKANGGIRG